MTKRALITITALCCLDSLGQGTVNFVNLNPAIGLDAPVVTCSGTRLPGPDYRVALLAGPSQSALSMVAETALLTGAGAGYFNGGVVAIPGVLGGGTAWVQAAVWDSTLGGTTNGATFAKAQTDSRSLWA
ncbi:MAG: hypothetical protein ACREIC_32205, partial [Limisphaerales bacterium]